MKDDKLISMAFMKIEMKMALDELNRLSIRNKEIYIFFDYELDQMNKSIISEKDFLQEIYSNKNTTLLYFGDEKAENFIGEET